MSSSCHWQRIEPQKPDGWLGDGVKFILRKKFGGSCFDVDLTEKHIPFLEGVAAASNAEVREQVQNLIDGIRKFEKVRVWEFYG